MTNSTSDVPQSAAGAQTLRMERGKSSPMGAGQARPHRFTSAVDVADVPTAQR